MVALLLLANGTLTNQPRPLIALPLTIIHTGMIIITLRLYIVIHDIKLPQTVSALNVCRRSKQWRRKMFCVRGAEIGKNYGQGAGVYILPREV